LAERRRAGLHYASTCVDRDDLPDFGAAHWAACIGAVRQRCPAVRIETLIGDMRGREADIATSSRAARRAGHNVETVPRLQRPVRHPALGAQHARATRPALRGRLPLADQDRHDAGSRN
jgi:lipoic acid synthetase